MTLEGGYNERIPESPSLFKKSIESIEDPLLRTPLQVRDSIIGTISHPPVIVEARCTKRRNKPLNIEIKDCPEQKEATNKPTDLTIFIPLNGNELAYLYEKTGCTNLEQIIERLQDIAIDCGLGFICAVDQEEKQLLVNLHKVQGAQYNKIMDKEQVTFINCFQNVLA